MHARIAVFEQRNPEGLSELRRIVEANADRWEKETGAQAFYALADPATSRGFGLSLFEDEATLRNAEPVFEKMGTEVSEHLRGKRTSVEVQEVLVHEVLDGAKAVRVSRLKGDPASPETFKSAIDHILPELRMVDGWKGFIACIDRTTGSSTAFTLWESRSALEASEREADDMRQRFADETHGAIQSVHRCDIVVSHDRAPRLVAA